MLKSMLEKFRESIFSILPITLLVIVIALTAAKVDPYMIGLFVVGAVFLIIGMSLFTLGADIAMMPMGQSVGSMLSKSKKSRFWLVLVIGFVIGFVITIAEPDLHVLASQLSSNIIIYIVAAGVGLFLMVSIIRTFFKIKLTHILVGCYLLVFGVGIVLHFVRPEFLAAAFDSGGVTTGPITVPFLMALGIGIAQVRGGTSNQDDSFGMIALCSIGPILAVMIFGLSGSATLDAGETLPPVIDSISSIFAAFGDGLLHQMKEVALALTPVVAVFLFFQLVSLKLPKTQIIRILVGILYTFVGLTIFLAGVNVGFMPMGTLIGEALAQLSYNWILIPIGMLMGCLIVLAEPAIHVLNKQVEEVTGGAISKKVMLVSLSVGVAIAIGLSMVRVLTGISIWYFIAPVYVISLILMYFVPKVFVGIAFDSGGVASGPMTATFLLPLAIGAVNGVGGNVFTDAFGLVAFVAMTPLITIQLVGLVFKLKTKRINRKTVRLAKEAADLTIAGNPAEVIDFDEILEYDRKEDELDLDTVVEPGEDTSDTVDFDIED